MKIIEYRILSYDCSRELSSAINSYLKQNWYPLGSPFSSDRDFNQAMVKYEEEVLKCDDPYDWKTKDLYLRIEALEKLVTSKVSFEDLKNPWEEKVLHHIIECSFCNERVYEHNCQALSHCNGCSRLTQYHDLRQRLYIDKPSEMLCKTCIREIDRQIGDCLKPQPDAIDNILKNSEIKCDQCGALELIENMIKHKGYYLCCEVCVYDSEGTQYE